MNMPFVSVIIPVQNDLERLQTCLQALERQSYPQDRYEILVVDNASDAPVASDASDASVEAPDAPAVAEQAPYVAPAEALDSQGFLRQLTFARATSTGAAKDSITLVGPDGRVFSAVGVRKTPEGLVVDLG